MEASRIRVLCVDDHPMVLEGLSSMIGRQPDMELVASTTSGEQAVEMFRQHQPDVTLMDLQLPIMSGVDAIRAIRAGHPNACIIVLTMFQGDEDIYRALRAGAAMYLLKDAHSEEVLRMIREVHAGGRTLPPGIVDTLATRNAHPPLTPREAEVMQFIAKGLRNKEIADALGISEDTTKVHVRNILSKLQVSDRSAAISVALRRGIIHIG